MNEVSKAHRSILKEYRDDMVKYAPDKDKPHIRECFNSIPKQEFVREYAESIGCHAITLNVWAGNDAAMHFYQSVGMQPQKTGMEIVLS